MLREGLSLQLESTRLEKAKIEKSSDSIRNFVMPALKKNNKVGQKRQMSYKLIEKFYVGELQEFDQYTRLNPIDTSKHKNELISLTTR